MPETHQVCVVSIRGYGTWADKITTIGKWEDIFCDNESTKVQTLRCYNNIQML